MAEDKFIIGDAVSSPGVVNVRSFGAKGDGVTDDTAAIQAALDFAKSNQIVEFPTGRYKVSAVKFNKKFITLRGSGTILDGKLVIGTEGTREDLFFNIQGLSFEYSTRAVGNIGIEFLKARRGTIQDCTFINLDKGIYVNPLQSAIAHDTAQIMVLKNNFISVNYAFYVDRHDAVTWMHTSDCKFIGNNVNVAFVSHVYCKSIDGIVVKDNVMFFPAFTANSTDRQNKKNNIFIGMSDWVIIQGNNLFEAGEEGIVLDSPKHFTISGNNVAWPGQKNPYSGILIQGNNNHNGIINDNVVSKFSKHGVQINSQGAGTVVVKDNLFEYDQTTTAYYGTTPISSIEHNGVNIDSSSNISLMLLESGNESVGGEIHNSQRGSLTSGIRVNERTQLSATYKKVSVTASNTTLFKVTSTKGSTSTFDGIILIHAKSSSADNSNLSSYVFHASKHPLGVSLTEISKQGLLTGNSANWTSFTFSLDNSTGELKASPVGSTSGEFLFYVSQLGNIKLS